MWPHRQHRTWPPHDVDVIGFHRPAPDGAGHSDAGASTCWKSPGATDGTHHTRAEVVASIKAGNRWVTVGGGVIRPINYCPASRCVASPYITTRADDSTDNNLENLPRC